MDAKPPNEPAAAMDARGATCASAEAARAFTRELAMYAERARDLAPTRRERTALITYLREVAGVEVGPLLASRNVRIECTRGND